MPDQDDNERLRQALRDALANLSEAAATYDKIDLFDFPTRWRRAVTMAGQISILIGDRGKNQRSAATHLGIRDQLNMPSLAAKGLVLDERTRLYLCAITTDTKNVGAAYSAKIDSYEAQWALCVQEWMGQVVWEERNLSLTREDIIWMVRDKEGYAHLDKSIASEAYRALKKNGLKDVVYRESLKGPILYLREAPFYFVSITPRAGEKYPEPTSAPKPLRGALDACVRSMATEVLDAFREVL